MFLINLIRFLKGYLNVVFLGDMCERILNICAVNSITLWNIRRKKDKIAASISVKDFLKLFTLRKRCRIRPHILSRHGLPFIFEKNKYRLGFCIGIAVFVVILSVAGSRIWNIKINGNNTVSNEKIMSACEKYGIYEGMRISKIDTVNSALTLPIDVDGIAWCAFNIEGTTLNIEIEEISKEEYHADGDPCNLIAMYDGIVTVVEVENGYSRVKAGDSVARGDVLVDGAVSLKNESILYSHSEGKIYAKTRRKITHSVPLKTKVLVPTGKTAKKAVISFFGLKIPLYLGECAGDYSFASQKYDLIIGGEKLPIYSIIANFRFQNEYDVGLSESEALIDCRGKLNKTLMGLDIKKMQIISENIDVNDGLLTVSWTVELEENIVCEEKLDVF